MQLLKRRFFTKEKYKNEYLITWDRLGFGLMTDLIVPCHTCHFTIDHKGPRKHEDTCAA